MTKKILITGASGLIGTHLSSLLNQKYSIIHLGRSKNDSSIPVFVWDPQKNQIDTAALERVDAIVHLAGANVSQKRWTPAWKKEILESRVTSSALLTETLRTKPHSVKTFITASAVGYYGFEGNTVFDEENHAGKDFLAEVTNAWESEADKIEALGIRLVKIRIGIVLTRNGGALEKMTTPIKYGAGAALGSGKQMMSWIHIDDLCRLFAKAIEDEKMMGAYNATANWATNEEMTKTIARILKKPLWLPHVPAFILKIIVGEMADIIVNGSRVSSEKIKRAGFEFQYTNLDQALKNLLIG